MLVLLIRFFLISGMHTQSSSPFPPTNPSSQLPTESLTLFLDTLLSHMPEEGDPRVIVVKSELPSPTGTRPSEPKSNSVSLAYDASVVFVLELATILAVRDTEVIAKLGEEVVDALQGVLRDASHVHPLTLSRTIYYLLSFLRASHVSLDKFENICALLTLKRNMTSSVCRCYYTQYPNSTTIS